MLIYLQMLETEEDRVKFEELYTNYRGFMLHIAEGILEHKQDAEDAVHQSFLSVVKNIHKITTVNSPQTCSYLAVITERKAIDIIRKKVRFVDGVFDEEDPGISVPPPGDSGLADAMAKLSPRYREVLLLRFDNGYSTKEIAKAFDMNQDSVQRLLHRAKVALAKALEDEEVEI